VAGFSVSHLDWLPMSLDSRDLQTLHTGLQLSLRQA
jgi:hypothetical protein